MRSILRVHFPEARRSGVQQSQAVGVDRFHYRVCIWNFHLCEREVIRFIRRSDLWHHWIFGY